MGQVPADLYKCPDVQISDQDKDRYLNDKHLVTLEALFAGMSIGNVLVMHYLLSHVIPYPITVTWFQFAIGLIYARVLGECGREFPQYAYFVPMKFDWHQMTRLIFPTIAFIAMIVFGNVLLARLPSISSFPVAASLAVCLHHATRFVGCGQAYRPMRWVSVGVMLLGFLFSCLDDLAVGSGLFGVALLYGISAAAYRGCFLERAMHTVRGVGNNLHNQQTLMGVIVLPFIIMFTRERRFFQFMPTDLTSIHTWLLWGNLATAAILPFVKNIVANRLIKVGGQPPWRAIELGSMLFIFLLGMLIFDRVTFTGLFAFSLVMGGRTLNSMDALANPPDNFKRSPEPMQSGPSNAADHSADQPFVDLEDGVWDPFKTEKTTYNGPAFERPKPQQQQHPPEQQEPAKPVEA